MKRTHALIISGAILLFAACGQHEHSDAAPGAKPHAHAREQTAGPDSLEEHNHADEHDESSAQELQLDPAMVQALGIRTEPVAAIPVTDQVELTGTVVLNLDRIAKVRARFPGPIIAVYKQLGERVAAGEALALIESNESLTRYSVRAPFAGTVLERNGNAGDAASEQPLFVLARPEALEVELGLFEQQRALLAPGHALTLIIAGNEVAGTVRALLPSVDPLTQTQPVRIQLQASEVPVSAGQFVRASVALTQSTSTTLSVPSAALQKLEQIDVVFVQQKQHYAVRTVRVGKNNGQRVEILQGLSAGERVVSQGSFLLKAELAKGDAEHEH